MPVARPEKPELTFSLLRGHVGFAMLHPRYESNASFATKTSLTYR